jgi:hypothetical protein
LWFAAGRVGRTPTVEPLLGVIGRQGDGVKRTPPLSIQTYIEARGKSSGLACLRGQPAASRCQRLGEYNENCTEMKTRLAGVSFGLTLAAAVFLLVWPIYAGFNASQPTRATLLQVNGPFVLIPVMFPVVTTLTALLLRKQWVRIAATILISGFAVIGGFTIGLFYLPAAIPMLLASCVADSAKLRDVF